MCSLFVLFCCYGTNTLRPCSSDAIGDIHRFPPPAAPQDPMVALPFRPPALNCQYIHTDLYPLGPLDQSSLPSLLLKAIFKRTHWVMWTLPDTPSYFRNNTPIQALWDSPIIPQQITCPSKPFSNQHAKPIPVRHPRPSSSDYLYFWTDTPSQSLQESFRHFSQYYLLLLAIFKPTLKAKHYETVPSFFNILSDPPRHFWTDTTTSVRQYYNSSLD